MNGLRIGGSLVIAGSIAFAVGAILIVAGMAKVVPSAPGGVVLVASLALLGVGLRLVVQRGSTIFRGTWTRRGISWLANGLLVDALLGVLAATPALSGSMVDILILPGIIAGWTTMIGFGITIVCLLGAADRRRLAGGTIVGGFVLLALSSALTNGVSQGAGIAVGIAAAVTILAGIAGIGVLAVLPVVDGVPEAAPGS